MTDEEKKAWDNLIMLKYFTIEKEDKQAIDIILNLIEKQQKEIEELKDKYSDEKIRNTVIKRYREVIEKDYIAVDKIKAKIEELEKLDFGTDLVSQFTANLTTITILQSLLEKE